MAWHQTFSDILIRFITLESAAGIYSLRPSDTYMYVIVNWLIIESGNGF